MRRLTWYACARWKATLVGKILGKVYLKENKEEIKYEKYLSKSFYERK